jgi:hypothetical protein
MDTSESESSADTVELLARAGLPPIFLVCLPASDTDDNAMSGPPSPITTDSTALVITDTAAAVTSVSTSGDNLAVRELVERRIEETFVTYQDNRDPFMLEERLLYQHINNTATPNISLRNPGQLETIIRNLVPTPSPGQPPFILSDAAMALLVQATNMVLQNQLTPRQPLALPLPIHHDPSMHTPLAHPASPSSSTSGPTRRRTTRQPRRHPSHQSKFP